MVNWKQEVVNLENEMITETQTFLQMKSVLDERTVRPGAPFGEGIRKTYDWLLNKANEDGFRTKDIDGYAGHIEWGEGEGLIGILCHIDVVPEGDGWTFDPYSAKIKDGKIYARGAIDDKGPTMAAYYALKIVKDLGVSLNKRVRLIIGTDEESNWRCVDHYFKHEEMPSAGFAPDADFPIIYAEKGICDLELKINNISNKRTVQFFQSGERLNMVPEKAIAKVRLDLTTDLENKFTSFLQKCNIKGAYIEDEAVAVLSLEGKSAHGMEPDKGINSGLLLASFINEYVPLSDEESTYFSFLSNYYTGDSRGENLGVAYHDEEKGDVTFNVGFMLLDEQQGEIGVNLRYPDGVGFPNILSKVEKVVKDHKMSLEVSTHEPPHAVDRYHPLIETLSNVYEVQTGEKAELIAIGGGTYARSLKAGVAFGPLFPGQEDVAHERDEYISIDQLKRATSIYAQAIYDLAK
ncbi:dipeptidase PepV [Bacillus shivajii]|uniref:dipeptidase PepV n=1 Tax=Bacillus shivajii TaxID=1983719 RepID=UPI001CF93CCE|nr:dipeptidase PepV [Bacillus shivajii]UCZ52337.1 dipeptidase PepV [Bacillus shivajii]